MKISNTEKTLLNTTEHTFFMSSNL